MKIQLGEVIEGQSCSIEYFLHPDGGERGMVIVFPGGGYYFLAEPEAEMPARKFVELGYHAAVCRYRVAPVRFPVQLQDACNAVRYTREHAAELGIKPDKIAVAGFSAGGHLAAMVSNMPDSDIARPNATILSYSVLSSKKEIRHPGSFLHLLGDVPESEYINYSMPELANSNTPPAFIWHTMPDRTVPVQNSVEYALALKKLNIDTELHLYPHGPHGLGTGERPEYAGRFTEVKSWTKLVQRFLTDRGW